MISKPKLKSGVLLVAQDLEDPNFDSTVVLICQCSAEGSYGLVINRPTHMPLSEVFENPPAWLGDLNRPQRIFIGGPVQTEELQVLEMTTTPAPGAIKVVDEVFLGGYWSELKNILETESKSIRIFLGYSGWAAGQLEHEIEANAWEIFDVDLKKVLQGPEKALIGDLATIKNFLTNL